MISVRIISGKDYRKSFSESYVVRGLDSGVPDEGGSPKRLSQDFSTPSRSSALVHDPLTIAGNSFEFPQQKLAIPKEDETWCRRRRKN